MKRRITGSILFSAIAAVAAWIVIFLAGKSVSHEGDSKVPEVTYSAISRVPHEGPTSADAQSSWDGDKSRDFIMQSPRDAIPELILLSTEDWRALSSSRVAEGDSQARRIAFSALRTRAKMRFAIEASRLIRAYSSANGGALPLSLDSLAAYTEQNSLTRELLTNPELIARYHVVEPSDPRREHIVVESTSPDEALDQRIVFGPNHVELQSFSDLSHDITRALRRYRLIYPAGEVPYPGLLLQFFTPPLSFGRQQKFIAEGYKAEMADSK